MEGRKSFYTRIFVMQIWQKKWKAVNTDAYHRNKFTSVCQNGITVSTREQSCTSRMFEEHAAHVVLFFIRFDSSTQSRIFLQQCHHQIFVVRFDLISAVVVVVVAFPLILAGWARFKTGVCKQSPESRHLPPPIISDVN